METLKIFYTEREGGMFYPMYVNMPEKDIWATLETHRVPIWPERSYLNGQGVHSVMFPDGRIWDASQCVHDRWPDGFRNGGIVGPGALQKRDEVQALYG